MHKPSGRRLAAAALTFALFAGAVLPAAASGRSPGLVGGPPWGPALLPTGQLITALAAPGSRFQRIRTGLRPDFNADANGAIASSLSPDGATLLVLTSGYNGYFYTTSGAPITAPYIDPTTGQGSGSLTTPQFQWVFVYDVTGSQPKMQQEIQLPNAYNGLAWDPSGQRFYVSGGQDDRIYIFAKAGSGQWAIDAPLPVLGHNDNDNSPEPTYDGGILKFTAAGSSQLVQSLGLNFGAMTAGVGVAEDGSELYAANLQDDSVSIVDPVARTVTQEIHLYTPSAKARAVGEFPYWVTPHSTRLGGPTDKLYVTSLRDGQILVLRPPSNRFKVITVGGEPGRMLLSPDQQRLYVANPDLDEVEVIDAAHDQVIGRISLIRPGYRYRGSSPNSLALSPDGLRLYVTCGNENSIAVIDLSSGTVLGRIPTGWQPSSVTVSADNTRLYVLNTKAESGPSPTLKGYYKPPDYPNPTYLDQYVYDTEKAGLETIPIPTRSELTQLSGIVDADNGFPGQGRDAMMDFLHRHIKRIIYIQKENRTYDQMLGDLGVGNGDPRLTEFPQKITPNLHQLALQFEDLDNWYMSSDVSGDGWNWAEQGRANDYTNKSVPVSYAGGGFDFEWNGTVRNQNANLPVFHANPSETNERMTTLADPSGNSNIEPGGKDIAATWGADDDRPGQTGGYIWDSVLRAGLSYRHYGLYLDETFYDSPKSPYTIPIVRDAWKSHTVQGAPVRPAITPYTDPYYRGWDLNTPDEYRFEEWNHEFQGYVHNRNLPAFETVLFMMDHMGDFSSNVEGLANPDTQQASDDHAVGELVDAVSHSPYWSSTAIFVLEDDSQDGPDHVDSHRSTAYVISPWVRHGSIVNTMYTDGNMLATMEDILGIDHLGMNDANAAPMDDVFGTTPNLQPYDVIIPGVLCRPPVHPDLVPECKNPRARKTQYVAPERGGAWWAGHTHRWAWSGPDMNDSSAFNRLVWEGTVGPHVPYPEERSGEDLSANRARVLATLGVPGPGRQ